MTPNVQSAIQIAVLPGQRGQGLSGRMVDIMKSIGRSHGLTALLAPIRPTAKHIYPLTPIERYVTWTNGRRRATVRSLDADSRQDGSELHQGLPARDAHRGDPQGVGDLDGDDLSRERRDYIVPGALNPVQIDVENDRGVYLEPNLWMHHAL